MLLGFTQIILVDLGLMIAGITCRTHPVSRISIIFPLFLLILTHHQPVFGDISSTLSEDFTTDPISRGRFSQQTAGTESTFTHDAARGAIQAVLDLDADAASLLSAELPLLTDRQTFSFSVRFRITEVDEASGGLIPTAVIGLVTTRHVDNFGDGLTLALAARDGKIFAGPNIDSAGFPKRSATNIVLEVDQEYLAFLQYRADSRTLRLDIFGGASFLTHIGTAVTESFPVERTLALDRIGLQNGGALVNDTDRGSITLLVDDLAIPGQPPVNLSVENAVGRERDGFVNFHVKMPLPADRPVLVDYSVQSGTAIAGADFQAVSSTLTIPEGNTLAVISIPLLPDGLGETNELFTLTLSNPRPGVLGDAEALGTILDNDQPFLSGLSTNVLEGNSGSRLAEVKLSLSNPSALPVSVGYRTSDGTALAGIDYGSTNGTVLFQPGSTSASVFVPVIGDLVVEGSERLTLELTSASHAFLTNARIAVEIRDDDALPLITVENAAFTEGDAGTRLGLFAVRLSAPSVQPVSFRYTTRDGTATAGLDFTAVSQVFTFSQAATSATVSVTIRGDVLPESDETFELILSDPVHAVLHAEATSVTGTILDDDRIPVLSVGPSQLKEGHSDESLMVFDLRLSNPPRDIVTVDYVTRPRPASPSAASAGVDFRSTSGRVTFLAGETNQTVTVPILGDRATEETEVFDLILNNPVGTQLATSAAEGIILDDDGVTLEVSALDVTEGDGIDAQAVFVIAINGQPTRSVTVNFATFEGGPNPARETIDFVPLRNGSVTFEPDEKTRTVSVGVVGDLLDESDETFELRLTSSIGAAISQGTAVAVIKDNDPPDLRVSDLPEIVEGETNATLARFVVRLSSSSAEVIRVEFLTEDRTARADQDYSALSGTLTFPPGTIELPVDIVILPDSVDELDENFVVKLRNPIRARIVKGEGLGTIKDTDEAPVITIGSAEVGECTDGTSEVRVTVTLSAPSERVVRADFYTIPDTAKAGEDFVQTEGTIEFPPGSTSQTIVIPLICDGSDEGGGGEGFGIGFSGGFDGGFGGGGGRVTIIDDDPPEFTVSDVTIREGNAGLTNAVFQINLSSSLDQEIAVNYFTSADSAISGIDYAHVSGTLLFPPGVTRTNVIVPVIADAIPEAIERYFLFLTNSVSARIVRSSATGTILDDDSPELRVDDLNTIETDSGSQVATLRLVLSRPTEQRVSFEYRTQGGTATAGSDFVESSGLVTFASMETVQELPLQILGDTATEGPERFSIFFSRATNATLPRAEAVITIVDNEGVPIVTVADVDISEGDIGQRAWTFILRLTRPSEQTVQLRCFTTNGTATFPADYARLLPRIVEFPPGVLTQRLNITVNSDTVFEGDEDFYLVLAEPVNAELARTQARGLIRDDDPRPTLRIEDVSVVEGAALTNAIFPVVLSAPASQEITFSYTTQSGTARSGSDFVGTNGFLTLLPGVVRTNIIVSVLGDRETELDESFVVQLSGATTAQFDRSTANGTIINDDGIGLLIEDSSAGELDQGSLPIQFTLKLAKPVQEVVTVRYETLPATATAESDFRSTNGLVTFPRGLTNQTIQVLILGDLEDEPNETFRVRLSAVTNASLLRPEATGTIIDNDPPRVSINDVTVNGGLALSTQAVFTVTLSTPSTETVRVRFTTANGTATAGSDYTQTTNLLSFSPGQTTQQISVPVLANARDERDEVFFVRLFNPTNATPGTMIGRADILNEEKPNQPPEIVIVAPSAEARFLVSAPVLIALNARDPDGQIVETHLFGDDQLLATFHAPPYTMVWSNLPPGSHVLRARTTDNVGAFSTSASVRITVEEKPILSAQNVSVAEGDVGLSAAIVPLTLSRVATEAVTINYQVVSDTALSAVDFTASAGVVVFSQGQTNHSITVFVSSDLIHESDETFRVVFSGPSGAALATTEIRVTVLDNDPLPSLSISSPVVIEGDAGTKDAVFTVTQNGETDFPVSVNYQTVNGTALSGVDYQPRSGSLQLSGGLRAAASTAPPSLQVNTDNGGILLQWTTEANVFRLEETARLGSANTWQISGATVLSVGSTRSARISAIETLRFYRLAFSDATAEIRVPIVGDSNVEAAETFRVELSSPVSATLAIPQGEATIIDNDQTSVNVTGGQIPEGNTGTTTAEFIVSLSRPSALPVSVDFATANATALAGADYGHRTGTLQFEPGETQRKVPITILTDNVSEPDEHFQLRLSNPINSEPGVVLGEFVILNDDAVPEVVITGNAIQEGDVGFSSVPITVALTRPSSEPVRVSITTADHTATAPVDYQALNNTVTFAPGETVQTIRFSIQGDRLDEPDETFIVRASVGDVVSPELVAFAEILIRDDDLEPSLSVTDVTFIEGDAGVRSGLFTVRLTAPSARAITVQFATRDGTATAGADFLAWSGSLTFNPGELEKSISVDALGDFIDEPEETFTIALSAPQNAVLQRSVAIGMIQDDDEPMPTLRIIGASVVEGNAAKAELELDLLLSSPSKQTISARYASTEGTASVGSDFEAATGTVFFPPGELRQTIRLVIVGDTFPEGEESFAVQLSEPIGVQIATGLASIVIRDDDLPTMTIAGADVIEGTGGTSEAMLVITLSSASPLPVAVRYTTVAGTASRESDFLPATNQIVFQPGETRRDLIIRIVPDSAAEPAEEFFVDFSGVDQAILASSRAVVTIRDDDGAKEPPAITLTNPFNDDVFNVGAGVFIGATVRQGSAEVERIDFYANTQSLGSVPFSLSVSFNWPDPAEGEYVLYAVATDRNGLKAESQRIRIFVQPNAGRKNVAIVQNFPDPEISKLQSWLREMDLSSRVFNQEGLTFDALAEYDLVIWDDLGTVTGGLGPNDVAIFNALQEFGIPVYFIGSKLIASANNLPPTVRDLWFRLIKLKPGSSAAIGSHITSVGDRHPVNSGSFGLVGEFSMAGLESAAGAAQGEQIVTAAQQSSVVAIAEDFARVVAQNVLAFQGSGLNAAIQRERLFKNAAAWLLRLQFPPFMNLRVDVSPEPTPPILGAELTLKATVTHSGESPATGIVLTFTLPPNVSFVSARAPTGAGTLDDRVVIFFLGTLSHADSADATVVVRVDTWGDVPIVSSVSPNQGEAVVSDNLAEIDVSNPN